MVSRRTPAIVMMGAALFLCATTEAAQEEGDSIVVNIVLTVASASGELLQPKVQTFPYAYGVDIDQGARGKWVMQGTYKSYQPDEPHIPFLLEITASGYKARVLEFGKDFHAHESDLRVVLEEGPYERTESVFSSVTGRAPTDEEVSKMPHARQVRLREREYRYLVAQGRVSSDEMPPEPKEYYMGISDEPSPPPPESGSLLPVMAESLEGVHGLPLVKVVDEDGAPVTEISVQWAWLKEPEDGTGEPIPTLWSDMPARTISASDGVFTVPNNCLIWSRGTDSEFVPASDSETPEIREIELPLREKETSKGRIARSEVREIVRQLKNYASLNSREARDVLETIRLSHVKAAAPAIRELLTEWEFKRDSDFMYTDELVATLATVQGDKATTFLEDIAADASLNPLTRRSAVIGLGIIGSEKSVAAYKRLRDAARSLPETPQAKESYTHAERIAEAVTMTCVYIPRVDPKSRVAFYPRVHTAVVDADYATAHVDCGPPFQSTKVDLRRIGDEWLVVKIGSTLST